MGQAKGGEGGFVLGHRLIKVFKWCFLHRRARRPPETKRKPKPKPKSRTMKRWMHSFKQGTARRLGLFFRPKKSPKGQLAVYVADDGGDTCRVLVPVVYFNHPLFGELLEEAEKEYGFNHEGGIKIPCPKSRLESVRMKIAAGGGGAASQFLVR